MIINPRTAAEGSCHVSTGWSSGWMPASAGMTAWALAAECRITVHSKRQGFTLVELLVVTLIAAILLGGLGGIIGDALQLRRATLSKLDLTEQAEFAMTRILAHVSRSKRLLLPLNDNPNTPQNESIHSVLAITLDATQDQDRGGFLDGDNDKDGKVDEDSGGDMNNDGVPGIRGIDDDKDGNVDEGSAEDDDESGLPNEEMWNDLDDDNDRSVDEDLASDKEQDGKSGKATVDEDGDGQIDEGDAKDDDEDGQIDEDGLDSVVYFLQGTDLIERKPNPHAISGLDYTEHITAKGITDFQVTRFPKMGDGRFDSVEVRLQLQNSAGESVTFSSRVRIGGGL